MLAKDGAVKYVFTALQKFYTIWNIVKTVHIIDNFLNFSKHQDLKVYNKMSNEIAKEKEEEEKKAKDKGNDKKSKKESNDG